MAVLTTDGEPLTVIAAVVGPLIDVPLPKEIVPPSPLPMLMPPPVPAIPLAAPVKLYVPVLPVKLRPVDVPEVVTLPLKLMVWALLPEMSTTSAPLACVIAPPHPIVPLPPPTTLNVEPVAPVRVPPPVLNEPDTPLRETPFVPPEELTLPHEPASVPLVRFSAVTAETARVLPVNVPKFVVFVMPVVVVPPIVTFDRVRFVLKPCIVTPVPALLIVPPLTTTAVALVVLTTEIPVVGPVALTLLNVTPEAPTVMPLRLSAAGAAPVVMFAVPLTFSVPTPAEKPVPLLVVMPSVPLKLMIEVAPLVLSVTAGFVVVPSVCVPVKLIVAPLTLLLTAMPVPLSVIAAPMFVIDVAPRFAKLMLRWPALAVIVFVLFMLKFAVPPLMVRSLGELLSVVFVIVTLLLGVVSTSAELAEPAAVAVTVSIVRPFVFVPEIPLADVPVTVMPLMVLPLLSVTPSPAVLVMFGFVPTATRLLPLTTRATPSPQSCSPESSLTPAL